jgi:tetratricopeptide (TPR) repeat protein
MLRRIFVGSWFVAVIFTGLSFTGRAFAAENDGQSDLDKATELKLTAETFEDLGTVINLTQSALSRGLDASNGDFAKKLLASSLVQRASAYSHVIFDKKPLDVRWNQIRQAALVDLERAIKNDNSLSEAQYMISRLQSLPGGNAKRALDAANEAIKLAGSDDRLKSKSLVLRAGLTEDKKKQLEDLDEAIKIVPGDVEALRMRGVYHLTQNKADLALKDLDEAAKVDPKQVDIHEARGLTLTVLKKYDDAITAFDKVLELEPEAYIAMLHRGRARFLKGDPKSALADLNTAAEKNENNPAILYLRARVHQQLGDTKERF